MRDFGGTDDFSKHQHILAADYEYTPGYVSVEVADEEALDGVLQDEVCELVPASEDAD
jgi:hypothetical protein